MNTIALGRHRRSIGAILLSALCLSLCVAAVYTANAREDTPLDSVVRIPALKHAIKSGADSGAYRYDSSQVSPRLPDEKRMKDAMSDGDYSYDRSVKPSNYTWMDWIEDWLRRHLMPDRYGANGSVFINIIMYSAIVVFIVLAGIWLSKSNVRGVLYGASKTMSIGFEEQVENIHELDMAALIEQAIAQSDYRRAVRYMFLQELKRLMDAGVVSWDSAKTNRVYIAEINDGQLRSRFRHLAWLFDNVWYGEYSVDRGAFEELRRSFVDFAEILTEPGGKHRAEADL